MAERYVSHFGFTELILMSAIAFIADFANLCTLFLLSPIINGAMFIILKLGFWLLGIKNSAGIVLGFVAFVSPTIFVWATYAVERAKEQSPELAEVDSVVSNATGPKIGGK